jgi:hypothetical protein
MRARKFGVYLFSVVVTVRRQYDEPAVDGKRSQFNAKAETLFMRKGGSYFRPLLAGLAVVLVLFDGEDVLWVDRCPLRGSR